MLPGELLRAVRNVLRRPLTTMKGSTVAALSTSSEQGATETRLFIELVDEQLNYVRRTMNDLVDIAESESGSLRLTLQPIDFSELVDEARNAARADGLRIAVGLEMAPSAPMVMADRNRIVQFLSNLFSATTSNWPDVSAIRLVATPAESLVKITVVLEGKMIAAESLSQLLARSSLFVLGESELETGRQDLAMAICMGIVNAHGGEIRLESDDEGTDSHITFTLRIATKTEDDANRGGKLDESAAMESASILIVGLGNKFFSKLGTRWRELD